MEGSGETGTSSKAIASQAVIAPRLRKVGYIGVPAYLVAVGAGGAIMRRLGIPAAAPLLLGAAGPLMCAAWFFSRLVSESLHGPISRFWAHMGRGNFALGGGFVAWALTLLSGYRPLGIASVLLALSSALWYFSAVSSRIRAIEGSGLAPLNIANLAAVVGVVASYYFYGPFLLLVHKRGLSPAVFVAIVIFSTSGLLYLLQVLFGRYRDHARPPDQIFATGGVSAMLLAIADTAYLLTERPMENVALAFAALVVVSPLAIAPLFETGRSLRTKTHPAVQPPTWFPIGLSGALLIPLALHLLTTASYTQPARVASVLLGAAVVTAASIAAQRVLMRQTEALAARQRAIESLYEKEAAKEAALLDILQRVSEGWSIADVVEGSLRAVVQTTSATRALFVVLDLARNRSRLLGVVGLNEEEIEELKEKLGDPYSLQRALRGGRTLTMTKALIPGLSDTSARFGAISLASTAISGWEEGGTAILCADCTVPGSRFTDDDIRMIEGISDYVSLALSRMRLFRELAASEERYRVLVEESTDGVVELDKEGRVLFSNKAFAKMIGKEPVQLLGESFFELLGVTRSKPPTKGEVTRTTAAVKFNAEEVILEIYQSTRRDGKIQALVRNVTERHNYAQRLRKLYEELAEKERLRTQALSKLIRAEEETRSRIAADLHDGPVQEFSRLAISLDIAKRHLEKGNLQEGFQVLADVRKSLSAELLRLRSLMTELRPPVLAERNLAEAIAAYCRAFENDTGILVKLATEDVDIEKSQEIVLYRIFQEAMTNVKKHSFARHLQIRLEQSPEGGVALSISDDGVGFDPSILESVVEDGHIGVVSMAERAELAGGSCLIESRPGQGTTVRVTIGAEVRENAG
ncbi:MAG: hypothetical protein C4319_04420 [Acidimicrobiia bacterium]